MAYDNQNSRLKNFLSLDFGMIFSSTGKAMRFCIQNNCKFRLQITSATPEPDGSQRWDWQKNSCGVTLTWNDMFRLYTATKEIVNIYHVRKRGTIYDKETKSFIPIDPNNPNHRIYTTKMIKMPLISTFNAKQFGEMIIGITGDPKSPQDETFAISIASNGRDDSRTNDSFIFDRSAGADGIYEYSDGTNKVHECRTLHIQFTDFVNQLEASVKFGRIAFGQMTFGMYTSNKNNHSAQGSRGAPSSGDSGHSSYDSGASEDIPF